MENMDRNKNLLKEKGVREIESRMERLREAAPSFLNLFGTKLVEESSRIAVQQLEIVLDCATKYGQLPLIEIVHESIDEYIQNDLSYKYHNKTHSLYRDLQDILSKWFRSRIAAFGELLKSQGDNYDELIKERFGTRDEAEKILEKEIEAATKAIRLIEANPKLLKLPFGVRLQWVIDILKKELKYSQQQLSEDMDRIYS